MTDLFQRMLHTGAVDPALLTTADYRAMLELIDRSLRISGGGAGVTCTA